MTLLDAFRELAPADGDDATIARRQEAAGVIFRELQLLAGRAWRGVDPADREDIASIVLIRLVQNGPRGVRAEDPASDDAVIGFLRQAIGNGLRDFWRRRRHLDSPEDFDSFVGGADPAEAAELVEAGHELEAARHQLFEVIVPELALGSRSGAADVETVRQLREIAAERLSVTELLEAERGDEPDEAATRRARNRLDKRFGRVRKRIHDEINRLRDMGRVTEERARTLKAVLESLRLRQ